MFHGSYLEDDVVFLLKKVDIPETEVREKEYLIQTKGKHYSEMLSPEYVPSEKYMEMFYSLFENNKHKFGEDILTLAENIVKKKKPIIVSLVRAGTPIGVLLKRTARDRFDVDIPHYSISIIRDREIDKQAIKHILSLHKDREIIFVDGWTGKGVINRELKKFISLFNKENGTNVSTDLYVVSDIAMVSDFAATNEDYLIPSATLNSTVSGLVSRSILNDEVIEDGDFHGCKFYKEYKSLDLSLWFVDEMMKVIMSLPLTGKPLIAQKMKKDINLDSFSTYLKEKYKISDVNLIKPGIGESTRVLLRRVPDMIFVKDKNDKNVAHIVRLSVEKDVPVIEDSSMPFKATAIIKDIT